MQQCPKCGKSIYTGSTTEYCDFCNTSLTLSSSPSTPEYSGIVWEHTESLNLFTALGLTIWQSLIHPVRFFNQISEKSNLFQATLFALTTGSIGILFSLLWHNKHTDIWEFFVLHGIATDFGIHQTSTFIYFFQCFYARPNHTDLAIPSSNSSMYQRNVLFSAFLS